MSFLIYPTIKESPILGLTGMSGGVASLMYTTDEDDSDLYFFHFLIPGHDGTTIDVMQKDGYLIIRTKDTKEEMITTKNPFTNYKYYKKVALSHPDYEVKEAVFKNGILSIHVKDMIIEKEKMNTKMIEVRTTSEN